MKYRNDFVELWAVYTAVISSFVVTILPILQFVSLCLAVALSIKKLREKNDK